MGARDLTQKGYDERESLRQNLKHLWGGRGQGVQGIKEETVPRREEVTGVEHCQKVQSV